MPHRPGRYGPPSDALSRVWDNAPSPTDVALGLLEKLGEFLVSPFGSPECEKEEDHSFEHRLIGGLGGLAIAVGSAFVFQALTNMYLKYCRKDRDTASEHGNSHPQSKKRPSKCE